MTLPLILLGTAAAGLIGYGAKNSLFGYVDKDRADRLIKEVESKYDDTFKKIAIINRIDSRGINQLNQLQLQIRQDIDEFHKLSEELLDKIHSSAPHQMPKVCVPQHELEEIKPLELPTMTCLPHVIGTGIIGGAAAYATYKVITALAAEELCLGEMIIVAAPVLAIAGFAYANYAEKAIARAKDYELQIEQAIKKLNAIENRFLNIWGYTQKICYYTESIYAVFLRYFDTLKKHHIHLTSTQNIDEIKDEVLSAIDNGYKVAAILANLMSTPLFKVKKSENVVFGQDKAFSFETDENGNKILNEDDLNQALDLAAKAIIPFSS